jgi:hypothetical protein
MCKNQDPRSGINIPDPPHCPQHKFLRANFLPPFFVVGPGIRSKHHGRIFSVQTALILIPAVKTVMKRQWLKKETVAGKEY